MKAVLGLKV